MSYILSVENLSKIYDGVMAVNNVSFKVEKGSVCGLLGPNGAGKTTLMKMIMNLVKCDRGSVLLEDNVKIRYLQDVPEFYDFYTIEEYLNFILDICKYEKDKDYRINEVLELLNLKEYKDKTIKKLSRGLRQKVGIAGVMIDSPDILLLDEPVSALDPIGRKEMFDIMKSLKGDTTIIFSSHILTDVERVCDHIFLISRGNIILDDELNNIALNNDILLVEFKNKDDLLLFKEKISYDSYFNENIENCLEIKSDDVFKLEREVLTILTTNEMGFNSISIKKNSLEEIFLREVKKHG